MAEIIENRVSYEVAELLKQKGFDEWCTAFYVKQGKNVVLQECDKSVCFEKCCNTTLDEYKVVDMNELGRIKNRLIELGYDVGCPIA